MKEKGPHKSDRYLISLHQNYELDYAVAKLKYEGHMVGRQDIRDAAKELNTRSRRKIYKLLRERFPIEINITG